MMKDRTEVKDVKQFVVDKCIKIMDSENKKPKLHGFRTVILIE